MAQGYFDDQIKQYLKNQYGSEVASNAQQNYQASQQAYPANYFSGGPIEEDLAQPPQQEGGGIFSGLFRGAKSGGAGVIGGQAQLGNLFGVGDGATAQWADEVAQANARKKEYAISDMIPFASDYWTNGEGAAYDAGNALGSGAVLGAETAAVMAAAGATAGALGIGSGAIKAANALRASKNLAPMGRAASARFLGETAVNKVAGGIANGARKAGLDGLAKVMESPLGKMYALNILKTPFEVSSEMGNAGYEALEKGASLPEAQRQAWVTGAIQAPLLALSNTFEAGNLGGILAGDAAKLGGKRAVMNALGRITGEALQNAWEEGMQQSTHEYAAGNQSLLGVVNPMQWSDEAKQEAAAGLTGGLVLGGGGAAMNKMFGGKKEEDDAFDMSKMGEWNALNARTNASVNGLGMFGAGAGWGQNTGMPTTPMGQESMLNLGMQNMGPNGPLDILNANGAPKSQDDLTPPTRAQSARNYLNILANRSDTSARDKAAAQAVLDSNDEYTIEKFAKDKGWHFVDADDEVDATSPDDYLLKAANDDNVPVLERKLVLNMLDKKDELTAQLAKTKNPKKQAQIQSELDKVTERIEKRARKYGYNPDQQEFSDGQARQLYRDKSKEIKFGTDQYRAGTDALTSLRQQVEPAMNMGNAKAGTDSLSALRKQTITPASVELAANKAEQSNVEKAVDRLTSENQSVQNTELERNKQIAAEKAAERQARQTRLNQQIAERQKAKQNDVAQNAEKLMLENKQEQKKDVKANKQRQQEVETVEPVEAAPQKPVAKGRNTSPYAPRNRREAMIYNRWGQETQEGKEHTINNREEAQLHVRYQSYLGTDYEAKNKAAAAPKTAQDFELYKRWNKQIANGQKPTIRGEAEREAFERYKIYTGRNNMGPKAKAARKASNKGQKNEKEQTIQKPENKNGNTQPKQAEKQKTNDEGKGANGEAEKVEKPVEKPAPKKAKAETQSAQNPKSDKITDIRAEALKDNEGKPIPKIDKKDFFGYIKNYKEVIPEYIRLQIGNMLKVGWDLEIATQLAKHDYITEIKWLNEYKGEEKGKEIAALKKFIEEQADEAAKEFADKKQGGKAEFFIGDSNEDTPSMAAVRKQYEGTDKWMKAPNGQPTKLDERQWLQVRTPEFKNWFGDWENDPENASKVVDENGEPLSVYHGTYAGNFEAFDLSKANVYGNMGAGIYFTDDYGDVKQNYEDGGPDYENLINAIAEKIANEQGVEYEEAKEIARNQTYKGGYLFNVFLDAKKPAVVSKTQLFTEDDISIEEIDENDYKNEDDYYDALYRIQAEAWTETIEDIVDAVENKFQYVDSKKLREVLYYAVADGGRSMTKLKDIIETIEAYDYQDDYGSNEIFRIVVEKLGYDAIIDDTVSQKFSGMNIKKGSKHYIVFRPNQVKSSVDNNGNFDKNDERIRYYITNENVNGDTQIPIIDVSEMEKADINAKPKKADVGEMEEADTSTEPKDFKNALEAALEALPPIKIMGTLGGVGRFAPFSHSASERASGVDSKGRPLKNSSDHVRYGDAKMRARYSDERLQTMTSATQKDMAQNVLANAIYIEKYADQVHGTGDHFVEMYAAVRTKNDKGKDRITRVRVTAVETANGSGEFKVKDVVFYNVNVDANPYNRVKKVASPESATSITAAELLKGVKNRFGQDYVDANGELVYDKGAAAMPMVAKLLSKAGITVKTDKASWKAIVKEARARKLLTGGSQVYGAVKDGVIYLNPEGVDVEIPIHEYTHLWAAAVKELNPQLWAKGVELLKQTKTWQDIVNSEAYKDLKNDDEIASEVLARLTGKRGNIKLKELSNSLNGETNQSLVSKIKQWLGKFWYAVKQALVAEDWTTDELAKIKLDDFINMPLVELMRGTQLKNSDAEKISFANGKKKADMNSVVSDAIDSYGKKEIVKKYGTQILPNAKEDESVDDGTDENSATTQVEGTRTMYVKALSHILQKLNPEAKTILDFSAGLGYGTADMRDAVDSDTASFKGKKGNVSVDSYELFPKRWYKRLIEDLGLMPMTKEFDAQAPTYHSVDAIKESGKKYDSILNTNVLNVVEPNIRDGIVKDIFSLLDKDGVGVITTRAYSGDVQDAILKKKKINGKEVKFIKDNFADYLTDKDGKPLVENNGIEQILLSDKIDTSVPLKEQPQEIQDAINGLRALSIPKSVKQSDGTSKTVKVYQRGFDGSELVDYIQMLLRKEFPNEKFVVTKVSSLGEASVKSAVVITKGTNKEKPIKNERASIGVVASNDTFKNYSGSTIGRSQIGVGKVVGSKIYFHKNYVPLMIEKGLFTQSEYDEAIKLWNKGAKMRKEWLPEKIKKVQKDLAAAKRSNDSAKIAKLERMLEWLNSMEPEWDFKTIVFDRNTGAFRFDEAPNFDTAREPIPARIFNAPQSTVITTDFEDQIWHHKWNWVDDEDYQKQNPNGFDVEESKRWSKEWSTKARYEAKEIGRRDKWDAHLEKIGLPVEPNDNPWGKTEYAIGKSDEKSLLEDLKNAENDAARVTMIIKRPDLESIADKAKETAQKAKQAYDERSLNPLMKDSTFREKWIDKFDIMRTFDKALAAAMAAKDAAFKGLKNSEKFQNKFQMLQNSIGGAQNALLNGNEKDMEIFCKRYNMPYRISFQMIIDKLNAKLKDIEPFMQKCGAKNVIQALDTLVTAEGIIEDYENHQKSKELKNKPYTFPKGTTLETYKNTVAMAPQALKDVSYMYYKYNKNLLYMLEKAGVINEEQRIRYLVRYKKFCPLMRDFSDTAAMDKYIQNLIGGNGPANVSNPLMERSGLGSGRMVLSPLGSTATATCSYIMRAERNMLGQEFVKACKDNGLTSLCHEVQTERNSGSMKESVITVMHNGQKKTYWVAPELYPSLTGAFAKTLRLEIAPAVAIAKLLRAGATTSPSFILRNFIRDTIFAGVSSKYGFIPFYDSIRGMRALVNDKDFRARFDAAGIISSNQFTDRDATEKRFLELTNGNTKEAGLFDIAKALMKYGWGKYSGFNELVEASTRAGAMLRAEEAGASPAEAAYEAINSTLNFGRSGTNGQEVNKVVPFFNACIQGGDRMYQLFKEDPAGTMSKIGKYILAPSLLLWLANHDEDWYKELDPAIKQTCWCLPNGIRIPKPQEAGIIFGSGLESMLDAWLGNDPKACKAWAQATFDAFMPNVIPTAILPLIEWQANYSFFRNKQIVSNYQQKLPDELQYGPYTSTASIQVGRMTGLSPVKLDNAWRSITGTMGMFALQSFDLVDADKSNLPEKYMSEMPLARDFIIHDSNLNRTQNDFYALATAADKQHRGYGKAGKPTKEVSEIQKAVRMVSKARMQMRDIENNKNLSSAAKRQRMDKIRQDINRICRNTINKYGSKFDY